LKTQTGTSQIDNFPIKSKKANNFPQKQTKPRWKFIATTTKKEGKGEKRTFALSWLMIFSLRASMVPSFINDSNTSSGVIIDVDDDVDADSILL